MGRLTVVLGVIVLLLVACGEDPDRERLTPVAPAATWTHQVGGSGAVYYVVGPQQAHPPEGTFPPGTKVRLVSEHGSYVRVQAQGGTTAYVATGSLRPLTK